MPYRTSYARCQKCGDLAVIRANKYGRKLCSDCRKSYDYKQCKECGKDISRRRGGQELCGRCEYNKELAEKELKKRRQYLRHVPLMRSSKTRVEDIPDETIDMIERIHGGERIAI